MEVRIFLRAPYVTSTTPSQTNETFYDKMDNQGEKIDLSDYTSSDSDENQTQQELFSTPYFGNSKLIKWMIKSSGSLIQNERQARYVLLILATLMITITSFLIFNLVKEPPRQKGYNPDTKYGGEELPDDFR